MSHETASNIWSVARLTAAIKQTLQASFFDLWVEGEISNLIRSGAGHVYLTLKDDASQLPAVLWRSQADRLRFQPHDGLQVLAHGHVDVYAARGRYQFVVDQLVPKGIGPLELAFRQLHDKLQREGLFDPQRKRPIPRFPDRIALITSPRGAAIRDFLEVAMRRWRGTEVIVIPSAVQGEDAPVQLCDALEQAQRLDVALVALVRGGGSLEDLWAFNDEPLARVIHASSVPVVAGIGHEVDVTIADLTADLRALTPSEAAERIFPDRDMIQLSLDRSGQRLASAQWTLIERLRLRVETAQNARGLRKPLELLDEPARRADDAERAFCKSVIGRLDKIAECVSRHGRALETLSPLHVLSRGYCLTLRQPHGELVRSAREVQAGDALAIRMDDGQVECSAVKVDLDNADNQ